MHNNAVMGQTLDKWIRKSFGYHIPIIVVGITTHIENGLFDIAYFMP